MGVDLVELILHRATKHGWDIGRYLEGGQRVWRWGVGVLILHRAAEDESGVE
jgi:hypothetical protein